MSQTTNSSTSAFIKLGRIGKAVEAKMGVSLANDVSIYLHEALANSFARDYPESYLSLIEEISRILHKPDAVGYDSKSDEIHYLSLFSQCGELFLLEVIVAHTGNPQKWFVRRVVAHRDLRDKELKQTCQYTRL